MRKRGVGGGIWNRKRKDNTKERVFKWAFIKECHIDMGGSYERA